MKKEEDLTESKTKELSSLQKFNGKWEELESESDVQIRRSKDNIVGTFKARLLDIRYDAVNLEREAIIELRSKDSVKKIALKNGRYELGDGYCIFVKGIIQKPEEVVLLDIKRKNQ